MTIAASGAHGAVQLLTDRDALTASVRRTVRLEAASDGKSLLLIDVDTRKPGIHREVRYEITPAELIAVIRAQGTELRADLPGERHADAADRA
jgi:Mrp family chromosome partitioning ATPase